MRITLLTLIAIALIGSITAPRAQAQRAPLPLGTVTNVSRLSSCPASFFAGMTCFQARMSCPNTAEIGFTYGAKDPSGVAKGTIVLLEGGTGKSASGGSEYAGKYLHEGFRIVDLAWESAWEVTGVAASSIKTAACRPATFLNYVSQNLNSDGAMCAQGDSAGSGAVAYSLAWYGTGNFLDKVELLSGPVFGNIAQGCIVPNAAVSTVCPAGQYGCNGAPWPDSPAYVGGDITAIDAWSGRPTCNGSQNTSKAANLSWQAMSIVDGTDNPSFSYPKLRWRAGYAATLPARKTTPLLKGDFSTSSLRTPLKLPDIP
jgi:hypothetical protein